MKKSSFLVGLCSFCLLCSPLASCKKETPTSLSLASIRTSTNGHGSLRLGGVDNQSKAALNAEVTIVPEADSGYQLEQINVNGQDITSACQFTVLDDTATYIVNASFVSIPKTPGETSVSFSGSHFLEIGKTMDTSTLVYGPDRSVTYSSSDTAVASISNSGAVTGLNPGYTTLTCTSVLSTAENPIQESFDLVVLPSYLARVGDAFKSYDYESGVVFDGKIDFCPYPSQDNPEGTHVALPFSLTVKTNKDEALADSLYLNLDLDTSNENVSDILSLLSMIIPGLEDMPAADSFSFTYIGSNPDFRMTLSDDTRDPDVPCYQGYQTLYVSGYTNPTPAEKTLSYFRKVDLLTLASNVFGFLSYFVMNTGGFSDYSSLSLDLGKDKEEFVALVLKKIMKNFVFSEDAEEGVQLPKTTLDAVQASINAYSEEYLADYKNSPYMKKLIEKIFWEIFPTSLVSSGLKVLFSEDGSFQKLSYTVKDKKAPYHSGDAVLDPVEYNYFAFEFGKKDAVVASDYFTNLKTYLGNVEGDYKKLEVARDAGKTFRTDIQDSVYDAIRTDKSLLTDLKAYQSAVCSLSDSSNQQTYLQDQSLLTSEFDDSDPYIAFKAYKQADLTTPLSDKGEAKVGDVFKFQDVSLFGGAETDTLSGTREFAVTASGKKNASDYVSFDATTNTLTVNALPVKDPDDILSDEVTITVSSVVKSGEKYCPVSFSILLKAAE